MFGNVGNGYIFIEIYFHIRLGVVDINLLLGLFCFLFGIEKHYSKNFVQATEYQILVSNLVAFNFVYARNRLAYKRDVVERYYVLTVGKPTHF